MSCFCFCWWRCLKLIDTWNAVVFCSIFCLLVAWGKVFTMSWNTQRDYPHQNKQTLRFEWESFTEAPKLTLGFGRDCELLRSKTKGAADINPTKAPQRSIYKESYGAALQGRQTKLQKHPYDPHCVTFFIGNIFFGCGGYRKHTFSVLTTPLHEMDLKLFFACDVFNRGQIFTENLKINMKTLTWI